VHRTTPPEQIVEDRKGTVSPQTPPPAAAKDRQGSTNKEIVPQDPGSSPSQLKDIPIELKKT